MDFEGEIGRSGSFRRPGAIPFQWEIQPGLPKHIADVDTGSPPPPRQPQKIRPPPAMLAAISPSPTMLPRSVSSSAAAGVRCGIGGGGGAVCFPSLSLKHRSEKRAMKIFSLFRRLRRRRPIFGRFVPRSSPSSQTEEDECEVGSSGRSLTPSDAGSF